MGRARTGRELEGRRDGGSRVWFTLLFSMGGRNGRVGEGEGREGEMVGGGGRER